MSHASDPALLALHGLRLKGMAGADVLASFVGMGEDELTTLLEAAAANDSVLLREGRMSGWMLTKSGRAEGERLLAADLDAAGARAVVQSGYERFLALNTAMLQVCTDWQVRDLDTNELNDHSDPAYDAEVIAELARIDREVQPILVDLTAALDRFGVHGPRFTTALERVTAGEQDWFAKPIMESYHTVWFELHEDLLASLGIDRASEGAH